MAKKNKETQPEQPVTEAAEAAETPQTFEVTAEQMQAFEEKLKTMEQQLGEEHDKYLRISAEYDNYRKRSAKEREGLYADVRADTILKLLPVYDNLERAVAQPCSDEAYAKGVEMTMNQLREIFTGLGVTEIPGVGEQFDPSRHNAVMHIEDENFGENTISAEFAKGFMLGDKVIRFSMVQVAN